MLVLNRKKGESLVFSNGIRITVMKADASRLRLGIEAPPDVEILREEPLTREPRGPRTIRRMPPHPYVPVPPRTA